MSPGRLVSGAVIIAALLGCRCGGSSDLQLDVRVIGQGHVVLGSQSCTSECQLRVSVSTPAVAVASNGWRFDGWSGLCAGQAGCVIDQAGELTANFTEESVVVLSVAGPGTVLASDGRRCTSGECRWPTSAPIGLTALPASGAEFEGYSGACMGTARCTLSEGIVQATFKQSGEVLDIDFVGTGTGVVRDVTGDYSCNQSCVLRVPAGAQLELAGQAAADSVFAGFSGPCVGMTCQVTAPANVQARFELGRRLVVNAVGNGGGSLAVDGLACATPCDLVVPADRPVEVTATPDDTSRFLGFSGDCVGKACSLGVGSAGLEVTVTFGSVLQWVRSFPIPSAEGDNVALYADDGGIFVAASVRRSMEIDGVLYAEPYVFRNGSPYFIELGWDGGVQSVMPFYDYIDAGYTRTDVASLTKGPNGALFAFGACFQGHFLGQPCGAVNISDGVPFVLEVQDGGVRSGELRVDLQDSAPVGFLDSHLVGDTLVARVFRHDQYPNGRSGFYVRGRNAGAGTITLAADLVSGGASFANSRQECIVDGESLVCISPVSGAFVGLGCPASAPGGSLVAYRYAPSSGACAVEWRMPAGAFALAFGVARSFRGRTQFIGGTGNGFYDFGSGFSLSGPSWWVGALDGASMDSMTSSPMPLSQLAQPAAVVASSGGGALVLAKTGPIQPGPSAPLFGIPLTVNDSAHVLTFNEAGQLVRRWPLFGGAANHEEIHNGTMTRVGDDIVVALMGSGYTFRGQPLAPDLQLRLFILVFRE